MNTIPVFDFHVHLGVWCLPDFQNIGATVADLDAVCVRYGLIGAAVTTTDGPGDAVTRNEALLNQIRTRPGYCFFPWINIREPGMLDFVVSRRAWVRGFKVHPSIDRVPFDHPDWAPLVTLAKDLAVPILVHCGAWKEMSSYTKVLPWAEKFPEVDFVLAHTTGGSFVDRTAGLKHLRDLGRPNLYVDITGSFRWRVLAWAIEYISPQQILFGSDYPTGHPQLYRGLMEVFNLTLEDRQAIYYQNALNLLSRKKEC
ncbi:MAG: amidohydrolase family protein [Deltaproteobacteria bacterium]|nr:amidohydrolase family protein [Deltaproteobacteria bacterium]